jgi:hypothetical protein
MAAPTEETVTDLLTRHLALIAAPIPFSLSSTMATMHMLNRVGSLQVDLIQQVQSEDFPKQLFDQLLAISKQLDAPALILQVQLALLIQEAIKS